MAAIKRRYDQDIPKSLNRLGKSLGKKVITTIIETRDPWLNLVQSKDKWGVECGQGKFTTRSKYSREEAMAISARHSKVIDLSVPAFIVNDALRRHIIHYGLPLFGETQKSISRE